MTDQARLSWAILISILLHALVLMSTAILRNVRLTLPAIPPSIEVDLAQLPPVPPAPPAAKAEPAEPAPPPPVLIPETEIVDPSEGGVEKAPPLDTRFLSDRDNVVEQESVRRAELPKVEDAPKPIEEPVPDVPAEPAAEPAADPVADVQKPSRPAAEKPRPSEDAPRRAKAESKEDTRVASLPNLDQLLPGPGDLAAIQRRAAEPPEPAAPRPRDLLRGGQQAPAIRSGGFIGIAPMVRESDITLLNTKAERFAPFVRRVAARVFEHLVIALRRASRRGASGNGREMAVVEAIMSRRGELVSARVVERETNTQMAVYRELLDAARPKVFFDANPPPGAESADGNIHFFLMVDLQVQTGRDPQTGRPASGYYGMAGVGLDVEP